MHVNGQGGHLAAASAAARLAAAAAPPVALAAPGRRALAARGPRALFLLSLLLRVLVAHEQRLAVALVGDFGRVVVLVGVGGLVGLSGHAAAALVRRRRLIRHRRSL